LGALLRVFQLLLVLHLLLVLFCQQQLEFLAVHVHFRCELFYEGAGGAREQIQMRKQLGD